jgi:hypothetical protein
MKGAEAPDRMGGGPELLSRMQPTPSKLQSRGYGRIDDRAVTRIGKCENGNPQARFVFSDHAVPVSKNAGRH